MKSHLSFLAVLALSAGAAQAQTADSWTDKLSGSAVHAHALVSDGTYLYSYGGGGWYTGVGSAATRRFDPVSNSWSDLAAMDVQCYHHAGAYYAGYCYAFGNADVWVPPPGSYVAPIYRYDVAADDWTTLASTLSTHRFGSAAAVVGTTIYICGGYSWTNATGAVGVRPEVDEFDPATGTVTPRAPLPTGTAFAFAGSLNGRLYYAGGDTDDAFFGAWTGTVATCLEYDPANPGAGWTALDSMPAPRAEGASFTLNARLYVAGGWDGSDDAVAPVASLYEFDPVRSPAWIARAPLPGGRLFPAGAATAARGYVYGGTTTLDFIDPSPIGTCHEYTPILLADPTGLVQKDLIDADVAEGSTLTSPSIRLYATAFIPANTEVTLEAEVFSSTGQSILQTRTAPVLPAGRTLTNYIDFASLPVGNWNWRVRLVDGDGNSNPGGWIAFDDPSIPAAFDFRIPAPPVVTSPPPGGSSSGGGGGCSAGAASAPVPLAAVSLLILLAGRLIRR